ncbi:hypothetical protein Kisp01_26490 [Kineosporia sp. NBRC 101677]|nr:hypothetical protein Kisp01_26490 [Kineosporia sp. NBRC 101677]
MGAVTGLELGVIRLLSIKGCGGTDLTRTGRDPAEALACTPDEGGDRVAETMKQRTNSGQWCS